MTRRLGVLISGRGSNLQAILAAIGRGDLDATVAVVISNNAAAPGLMRARDAAVPTAVLDHREYGARPEYDSALVRCLRQHDVGLVCLAGFMRLLGPGFVEAFPAAILNVHPSLLPAFPGIDAPRQAVAHGVKVSGCTVHFVTEELDAAVWTLVEQVAKPSPLTMRIGKEAFYRQIDLAQADAYALMTETMTENAMTCDAQEGMSAFLEKRVPVWQGR